MKKAYSWEDNHLWLDPSSSEYFSISVVGYYEYISIYKATIVTNGAIHTTISFITLVFHIPNTAQHSIVLRVISDGMKNRDLDNIPRPWNSLRNLVHKREKNLWGGEEVKGLCMAQCLLCPLRKYTYFYF